jgi:hypothetical protein
MALTASIKSKITAVQTAAPDLGSTRFELTAAGGNIDFDFTDGSGLNQANKIFADSAAATTTYDLDGSLTGPLGTVTFSRIVAIRIKAATTNAAAIAVGGDFILTKYLTPGADTLSAVTIPVHIGGMFTFVAPSATGVAITATTGDQLTLTVTGSDAFDIVIIGS